MDKYCGTNRLRNSVRRLKAPLQKLTDFLSGTVTPVIPVFVACGMLTAVMTVLTNFCGVNRESGTAVIFSAIGSAGFYFMPVFIGCSAAKQLQIPPLLGAFLGAVLVYSAINNVPGLDFLGLPVHQTEYGAGFLPALLGTAALAWFYRLLQKILPKTVQGFLLPTLSIAVTVPATLLFLGPAGSLAGAFVADGLQYLGANIGFLAVGLWAFLCPVCVMAGVDKAVYALTVTTLATVGYDAVALVGGLAGNAAIGGTALAVWVLSRDTELRALAASSGFTAILGVTEPALYGICVKYRRPLFCAMVGAGLGGLFAGAVGLKQYAWAGPGLMTCPVYLAPDGSLGNFVLCLLTILVSAVCGFVVTLLLCRGDKKTFS